MMPTILGFLTALAVGVWGLIWFREGEPRSRLSVQEMKARLRPNARAVLPPEELQALLVPTLLDLSEEPTLPWEGAPPVLPATDEEPPPMFVRIAEEQAVVATPGPVARTPGPSEAEASPPPATELPKEDLMGYCARCRAKRFLVNPEPTTTRQGRPAVRGLCMICNSEMLVFTFDT